MKKYFIFMLLLFVTACAPSTPEEVATNRKMVESNLPAGCKIGYAGRFQYGDSPLGTATLPVVYVQCNAANATTMNTALPQKGSPPMAVVTIDEINKLKTDINKKRGELSNMYDIQKKQLEEIEKMMNTIDTKK